MERHHCSGLASMQNSDIKILYNKPLYCELKFHTRDSFLRGQENWGFMETDDVCDSDLKKGAISCCSKSLFYIISGIIVCIVWILLKMLCFSVLASFSDAKLLDIFCKRQQHEFTYKWNAAYYACAIYMVLPLVHA